MTATKIESKLWSNHEGVVCPAYDPAILANASSSSCFKCRNALIKLGHRGTKEFHWGGSPATPQKRPAEGSAESHVEGELDPRKARLGQKWSEGHSRNPEGKGQI